MNAGKRAWDPVSAQAPHRKISGLVVGGSTAEGAVAKPFTSMLATQLEKMLQQSYNSPGSGGYVVRARDSAWRPSGKTSNAEYDLGIKSRELSAGASITHSTVGASTGLTIQFSEGPDLSPFDISIDGRAPITVVPRTALPSVSSTGEWVSSPLAQTPHTFTIRASGKAVIGNTRIHLQDRNSGISLFQGAHAGFGTADFLEAKMDTMWERVQILQPEIVFVLLGSNDRAGGTTATQFGKQLDALIKKIDDTSNRDRWIIIVGQHQLSNKGPEAWPAYLQQMKRVATEQPGCSYSSYYDYLPKKPGAKYDPSGLINPADETHMTARGHRLAARVIAHQLGLPSALNWM